MHGHGFIQEVIICSVNSVLCEVPSQLSGRIMTGRRITAVLRSAGSDGDGELNDLAFCLWQ